MEIVDNFLQDKYKRRRAIIMAIFIAVFLCFSFFIYLMVKPSATCLDGVKNQNEEGVDCGGVCPAKCKKTEAIDLSVVNSGFLESGAVGEYDLYGKVANPNNTFGGGKFKYEFILKDDTGAVLANKSGYNFILPGESKYIVENNVVAKNRPASVELRISDAQWVQFNDHYESPQLKVVNKVYSEIHSGVGFSEATGLLKNESPYDFSLIKLAIILKDANDRVVAVNSTEMRTVRNGENRDFKALWFNRFAGAVMNVEVQSEANIFDSETFAQQNFSSQSLQDQSYR